MIIDIGFDHHTNNILLLKMFIIILFIPSAGQLVDVSKSTQEIDDFFFILSSKKSKVFCFINPM
jgi:hypothetical protein